MKTAHFLLSVLWLLALASANSPPLGAQPATGDIATIYDVRAVDQAPEPKKRIKPSYPSELRKRATPADITLRFVVTAQGKVTDITVVKFSDSDMVEPVFSAYENARFNPGLKGGKPVSTRMEVTEIYPEPKAPKK